MPSDTKGKNLETLIVEYLRDQNGYELGANCNYDRSSPSTRPGFSNCAVFLNVIVEKLRGYYGWRGSLSDKNLSHCSY